MDVLVLGGTAWLGGEIARQAQAGGDAVTCVARGRSGTAPDGVTWVTADRDAPGALAAVADRDWDLVLDVARQPGQVRAAVAALGSRAARWMFVSTISVYAGGGGDDETATVLPALDGDVAAPHEYGEGKVACEDAVLAGLGDRAVVARLGLVGGPGDGSQRSTYWPRRVATGGEVLVPDAPDQPVQLIDVRDAAAWLLAAGANPAVSGVIDLCGPTTALGDWWTAGSDGADGAELVHVDPGWLVDQQVNPWMGPRSLPLWLPEDAVWVMQRSGARARAAGLVTRPYGETIRDLLAADEAEPLGTRAGLTSADERELLALWRSR